MIGTFQVVDFMRGADMDLSMDTKESCRGGYRALTSISLLSGSASDRNSTNATLTLGIIKLYHTLLDRPRLLLQ